MGGGEKELLEELDKLWNVEVGPHRRKAGELIEERVESKDKLVQRLLYCCEGDVKLAVETLSKDLRWRDSVNMQHLVRLHPRDILGADPRAVSKLFLCKIQGTDKAGRPVLYYSAKTLDARGVLHLTSLDKYMLYQAWWREVLIHKVVQEKPNLTAPYYSVVLDLHGVRLAQASRDFYSVVKRLADLDQWHFPGMVGRMVIVNAPFFFTLVWKAIRKFLSPQVEKKISIIGSGKKEIYAGLSSLIHPQEIPSDFYGNGPCLDWDELEPVFIEQYHAMQAKKQTVEDRAERIVSSQRQLVPERPAVVYDVQAEVEPGEQERVEKPHEQAGDVKDARRRAESQVSVVDDEFLTRLQTEPTSHVNLPELLSDLELDPGSALPPHIAILVYDRSDPPRPGLRSEILHALESINAEKDAFERQALNERKRLRWKLRQLEGHSSQGQSSEIASRRREIRKEAKRVHATFLSDPTNLEIVKNGLRARIAALKQQVASAREECNGYGRAVKFARNYLEQEATRREQERKDIEATLAQLKRENRLLGSAVKSSLGEEAYLQVVSQK